MRAGRQRPVAPSAGVVVPLPLPTGRAAEVEAVARVRRVELSGKVLDVLDVQMPYIRGSVLAAGGCAEAMRAAELLGEVEPDERLVGLRWALEEARCGLDELRKDLKAVLDAARERGFQP